MRSPLLAFSSCAIFALAIPSHAQDAFDISAADSGNQDDPVLIDGAPGECNDPGCIWYNGIFDGRNGGADQEDDRLSSRIFDDFVVPDGQVCTVTGVLGEYLTDPGKTWTRAYWEIRTGVALHTPGTLVASGTNNATMTLTGRMGFGRMEYRAVAAITPIDLGPGRYFITVAPSGNGQGQTFVSSTSGSRCVGEPCGNNGNSWWYSTFFGFNYEDTQSILGPGPWDFAYGVVGTCACGGGPPVSN